MARSDKSSGSRRSRGSSNSSASSVSSNRSVTTIRSSHEVPIKSRSMAYLIYCAGGRPSRHSHLRKEKIVTETDYGDYTSVYSTDVWYFVGRSYNVVDYEGSSYGVSTYSSASVQRGPAPRGPVPMGPVPMGPGHAAMAGPPRPATFVQVVDDEEDDEDSSSYADDSDGEYSDAPPVHAGSVPGPPRMPFQPGTFPPQMTGAPPPPPPGFMGGMSGGRRMPFPPGGGGPPPPPPPQAGFAMGR